MALSTLNDILRAAKSRLVNMSMPTTRQQAMKKIADAKNWFRNRLKNKIYGKEDPEIETNTNYFGMISSRVVDPFGRLSFFIYQAENDAKLPYWDAAPLTLIYGEDNAHLYGLNFHYVHPMIRVKILSSLIDYMVNANNERAYLAVTYSKIKALSTHRYIRPCVKTYLKSNFLTPPIVIKPDSWHNAVMLPTAQWKRATNNRVWSASSQQF